LPAHIAVLDSRGVIVSVNDAWRRFADANALQCPGHAVGLDYVALCERARGERSAGAREAGVGMRAVLEGRAQGFELEYPCHSPTRQRWLLLKVTPLADEPPIGAVVMHLDVTAQKQVHESLHVSELLFRQMAENIRDVFFLRDAVGDRMLYVSPAYETIWGRSCASLYADPASWLAAVHPEDRAAVIEKDRRGMAAGEFAYEHRIVRPDGAVRWIETRAFPVHDKAGRLVRVAGVDKDITERKGAEDRIAYLNRVYATLSGINALILRARSRDELFRGACRVAVEMGGFRMAWIGSVDQAGQKIQPVASAGMGGHVFSVLRERFSLDAGTPLGGTLTARAVREKRVLVANDALNDPAVKFRREYGEAGIRSLAVLPLTVLDEVVGVLVLFTTKLGFFHAEELTLLTELAGDVGFAIDHIGQQERLAYLAFHDVLTGLANRALFLERVTQYMRSAVTGKHKLAVCLLDLERFRNVNDSLGRAAGDQLLKAVAVWLVREVGDANVVARMDADHFAVVMPALEQASDLARRLEKSMQALVEHPFTLADTELRVAVKIGVAVFPDHGASADTLFRNAEAALKKAQAGGDRYLFYTQQMTESVALKLTLENQLRQALDRGEFVLHYQPKVSLASGRITGVEALIRWNDPRTGLVPPNHFIPVLEETGLIYEVGRWALCQAGDDYRRWRQLGLAAVPIAVNVSPLQLRHRHFIADIERKLDRDGDAAAGLELEITESLVMADVTSNIVALQAIRALGVGIAIDDFGTGFSSLAYLSRLPANTLKIDRSFVVAMTAGPKGLALVAAIVNMAHALEMKVVAEGVETEEQARLLRLLNCDEMQGYFFSRPLPSEALEAQHLLALPMG